MEVYVIVRDDGWYVTVPGSEESYSQKLEEAWTFRDKAIADKARCPGNERVMPVSELLIRPV